MGYKEIRKKIEFYEKKCRKDFMIYGDNVPTEHKRKRFLSSKNEMEAALLALFDFCEIYRHFEENLQIEDILDDIRPLKISLEKGKESNEINENCARIYKEILQDAQSLRGKELLKLVKYGREKKLAQFKSRQDSIMKNLYYVVTNNYKKYKLDKNKRENRVFHVGTDPDYIKAFENQITEEEIIYTLVLKAINDAFEFIDKNVIISEELSKINFEKIEFLPKERNYYYDDKAYELSSKAYELYNEAFHDAYTLSKKYREKLRKKIDNKLELKEQ